jgi:hypothetical protein
MKTASHTVLGRKKAENVIFSIILHHKQEWESKSSRNDVLARLLSLPFWAGQRAFDSGIGLL